MPGPTGIAGPAGSTGPLGPTGPEGPPGTSAWTENNTETRTTLEVGVQLVNQPALGALDIGDDFVMRDATDIGGGNSRVRFHVLPESDGLSLLRSDDDDADVEIVREKDSSGGGTSTKTATVKSAGSVYEDPEVPEVRIVVEPDGGGGGTSDDPFLKISGGGLLLQSGLVQLAMGGGAWAQIQPSASGGLELIGGDASGNEGLIGFDFGPVLATSLDTGPIGASSVNATSVTTYDLNTTNLFADNFSIDELTATNSSASMFNILEGGSMSFDHSSGSYAARISMDELSGDLVATAAGLTLKDSYFGDTASMRISRDSLSGNDWSLVTDTNLQVGGELAIREISTGDQIFFQVEPRLLAMTGDDEDDEEDDDDGVLVVKRRKVNGTTSTSKVKSSGSVYEDPDVPEVRIVVEPDGGGGGTSEDPFLKLTGGDLRLMDGSGLQFGTDAQFSFAPITGGWLGLAGGGLNAEKLVANQYVQSGVVYSESVYSDLFSGTQGSFTSVNCATLNAANLDVASGGALLLSNVSGSAAVGLDSSGYLDMSSPMGVAMTNVDGESVLMEVVTEQGTLSGGSWGSLNVHAPMSTTTLSLGYLGGETATLLVTNEGLLLDNDLAVEGDVSGTNGSFASNTSGSGLVGGGSGVVDAIYTGPSSDRPAVRGKNESAPYWGIGGYFQGGYMGVNAIATVEGDGTRYGLNATASGGVYNYGVQSVVADSGATNNYGLKTSASGGTNNYGVRTEANGGGYGLYAKGQNGAMAGTFIGNVNISGNISKGGGSFKIDHPLDPENKYLYHSFVESPDMMNVYNGNAVFDASGEIEVELPDWFEELNREFRYQLTCVGGFAPVYVSKEIEGNRFTIAGGHADMKVSWQVTGIRKDPWAEANRIPTEVEKAPEDRGYLLHPEAHGRPLEEGLYHQRDLRADEGLPERRPQVRAFEAADAPAQAGSRN